MTRGFASVDPLHRSILIVRSVARLGSAFTASIARAISACPGLSRCACARMDSCWTGTASDSAAAKRAATVGTRGRASVCEGTSELLLDVPCLELCAPVQVDREPCPHVERLEKQYRHPVRKRAGQRKKARRPAGQDVEQFRRPPGGREPERKREQRKREGRFGQGERVCDHHCGPHASAPDLTNT